MDSNRIVTVSGVTISWQVTDQWDAYSTLAPSPLPHYITNSTLHNQPLRAQCIIANPPQHGTTMYDEELGSDAKCTFLHITTPQRPLRNLTLQWRSDNLVFWMGSMCRVQPLSQLYIYYGDFRGMNFAVLWLRWLATLTIQSLQKKRFLALRHLLCSVSCVLAV